MKHKALRLLGVLLLSCVTAFGQAANTLDPLTYIDAEAVNGMVPGYWPSQGGGLTLNISQGAVFCNGTLVPYAGGTLAMAASATNYVSLDPGNACAPGVNTSGFIPNGIPLAIVPTNGETILTVDDSRTPFNTSASGGGGGSVGTAGQVQMVGSTAGSFAPSAVTDNGTTVSSTEPVSTPSVTTPLVTFGPGVTMDWNQTAPDTLSISVLADDTSPFYIKANGNITLNSLRGTAKLWGASDADVVATAGNVNITAENSVSRVNIDTSGVGATFGGQVQMDNITGHGTAGIVGIDTSGNLSVTSGGGTVSSSGLTSGYYPIATGAQDIENGGIYDDGTTLDVTTLSHTGTPAIQMSTSSNDSLYNAGVIFSTTGSGNATMAAGVADTTSEKFILDSVHGTRLISQNGLAITQDGGGIAAGLALTPGSQVPTPWIDGGTYVQLVAPVSIDTSYNLILPTSQGTGALTNDGLGNLSFTPVYSVDVTQAPYNAACDGSTDDHVTIQAALNSGALIVDLPVSTATDTIQCNLGSTGIDVPWNVTLQGNNSYLGYAGTGTAITADAEGTGISFASILNLNLDMTGSTGTPAIGMVAGRGTYVTETQIFNGPVGYTALSVPGNGNETIITHSSFDSSVVQIGPDAYYQDISIAPNVFDAQVISRGFDITSNEGNTIIVNADVNGTTFCAICIEGASGYQNPVYLNGIWVGHNSGLGAALWVSPSTSPAVFGQFFIGSSSHGITLVNGTPFGGTVSFVDGFSGAQTTTYNFDTAGETFNKLAIAGAPSGSYIKADGTGYGTPGGSPMVYPSAGLPKSTGSAWTSSAYTDFVAEWAAGSCVGYLKNDGTCSNPSAIASSLINGANVVLTGDSHLVDDSGNTLGAVTTPTATSCTSGGLCTITDTQSYTAGQWVHLSGNPTCPGAGGNLVSILGYYGTGESLYQVLASGLSGSQFEIQTRCTSAGALSPLPAIEDATGFMSMKILTTPAFANVNAVYLRNGEDHTNIYSGITGTICDQSTNFALIFGDLYPATTGKPLYILEDMTSVLNDIGGRSETEGQMETCFQSVWSQAHAVGAKVVQSTSIYVGSIYTSFVTYSDLANWVAGQAKTSTNLASGQYWDYFGVDGRATYPAGASNPIYSSFLNFDVKYWNLALLHPESTLAPEWLYTPYLGDATADSLTIPDGSADVALSLGLSGTTNTQSQKIQGKSSAGTSAIYYGADGFWHVSGNGFALTQLVGAATAPTGACSLNGAWQLTQDGQTRYCLAGTWTAPSGVTTFNSRSGAIVPTTGDYTAAQVTNAVATNSSNTINGGTQTIVAPNSIVTPLVVKGSAGAPPVTVLQSGNEAGSFTMATATLTAGATMVVTCHGDVTQNCTVSDSQGNSYTDVCYTGGRFNTWVATGIVGGADTISVSDTGSDPGPLTIDYYELSQSAVSGTTVCTTNGTNAMPWTTPTVTLSAANGMLVAGYVDGGGYKYISGGTTNVEQQNSLISGYLPVSASGAASITWTTPGGGVASGAPAWVVGFVPSGSGAQVADLVQHQTPSGTTVSGVKGPGFPYIAPTTYALLNAALPCTSTAEGSTGSVTDSTVTTGVITGGGSNHVSAYCNGTNWIVQGGGSGGGVGTVAVSNTVSDYFLRTGGNLGANWTNYVNGWVPNSGAAHATTASQNNVAAYTASTVSPTQGVKCVNATLNGTTDYVCANLRISGTPGTSASFYSCIESTGTLAIAKVTNVTPTGGGTTTTLASAVVSGLNGDQLYFNIVGGTMTCYLNRNTGGTTTLQAHDTSFATGYPGIQDYGNTATVSSFTLFNAALGSGCNVNIVADGDSITYGYGLPNAYTDNLVLTNGTAPCVTNLGVDGKAVGITVATGFGNIESMITTGTSVVDTLYTGGVDNIVVIWGGTNDIANGQTVAQTITSLTTYVTARHAAGWKVVLVPGLSRITYDTSIQSMNQQLGTVGADVIATLPLSLTGTGAYLNTTYFQSDHVHPTQVAVNSLIAPAISAAISSLK